MVKTQDDLTAIAKHYLETLATKGIRVEKVIVFGSYGRGTATEK